MESFEFVLVLIFVVGYLFSDLQICVRWSLDCQKYGAENEQGKGVT